MSNAAIDEQREAPAPAAEHAHHDDSKFLAHHFGSAQQQFDAGKLGMWLFLITEVLFFSGLFCAYAVYRANHPEAFANADQYLDVTLGAANTIVLLFSSLTMAWAVRAAQLGQQTLLVRLLLVTLCCASAFLGVKAVEYSHKWDEGVLWASKFQPVEHGVAELSKSLLVLSAPAAVIGVCGLLGFTLFSRGRLGVNAKLFMAVAIVSMSFFGGVAFGKGLPWLQQAVLGEKVKPGHAGQHDTAHDVAHGSESPPIEAATVAEEQQRVYTGIFFSIYYMMTGLHAIHILAGMGVIFWLLRRAMLGHFTPNYFGPVDYVGLYWHLVDLVWIYLFPLLYLIG